MSGGRNGKEATMYIGLNLKNVSRDTIIYSEKLSA